MKRVLIAGAATVGLVTAAPSRAQQAAPTSIAERPIGGARDPSVGWAFGAYGETIAATHFYHPDPKQTGPYRQTSVDLTRLSFFVDNRVNYWLSFTAELEIEHGGTGIAKEVEWDEFGEYETELEKGGEVQLEQAYLEAALGPHTGLRVGHLLVPVGMTSTYHTPNMFSGTRRPESEAHLLPSVWHETGIELFLRTRLLSVRLQIATGLDSSGFSSSGWISGGSQRRFETTLGNDLGLAFGLDFTGIPHTLVGISGYTSASTANRPKRDLDDVEGRVVIADVHVRGQYGPLRLRGMVLAGTLGDAERITARNATLSNALGVPRTKVGSGAYALWAEAALDVLAVVRAPTRHRLDVFARFDAYDTMWRAPGGIDNPLLERRALTTGLNYFPHPRLVVKAEGVSRWINQASAWGLRQTEINGSVGFVL